MAKKNTNYISARDSRKIAKENRKITAEFEKKRNRKVIPEEEYVTSMKDPNNCVEFDDVHTYFFTDIGTVKAVDGVSFNVPQGKTIGIVGESGCGKSVTSLSMLQLVQARTIEMLGMVGIANKEGVYSMYPHELSGGMRQRICIAMALACDPKLIVADEPTTALDVTIQAQILDLLRDLKDRINSSIMLITHDLGVVAEMADYVVVMYAGRVVEKGTAREIFKDPRHPYTIGLMKSKPVVGQKVDELYSIPGSVPNPINMPDYCYFKDRCEMCVEGCDGAFPEEYYVSDTHMVRCYRCAKEGVRHE